MFLIFSNIIYIYIILFVVIDVKDNREDAVKIALSKAFRPGQFFMDMRSWKVKFGLDRDTVLHKITAASKQYFAGNIYFYLLFFPIKCIQCNKKSLYIYVYIIIRSICTECILG